MTAADITGSRPADCIVVPDFAESDLLYALEARAPAPPAGHDVFAGFANRRRRHIAGKQRLDARQAGKKGAWARVLDGSFWPPRVQQWMLRD